MKDILSSKTRVRKIIIGELQDVIKKYAKERRSEIVMVSDTDSADEAEEIPDYAVNLFFTKEGYFKKITPLSLRMGGDHKLKDGDEIIQSFETTNNNDLLFFTDKCQVYKAKVNDFADSKASVLGEYIPSKLEMEEGENAIFMVVTNDYKGYMFFLFENGKAAKVNLNSYATKTNRKKLIKAYCDKSPLAGIEYLSDDGQLVIETTGGRCLLLDTAMVSPKAMKDTQGVACITLKKNQKISSLRFFTEGEFVKASRYKAKNLPSAGAVLSNEDAMKKNNITFDGFV